MPTDRLRVTMLISRFPPSMGGTESQAYTLGRELAKRGVDVHILTQRYDKRLPGEETADGMIIHRVGPEAGSFWASARYVAQGLDFLLRMRPQPMILHAHMMASPAVLGELAGWSLGARTLVKIACSGPYGDVATSRRRWFGKIKLWSIIKRMDKFVCISKAVKEEMLTAGANASRLVEIPNGVDTDTFRPPAGVEEKERVRQELGLAPRRWILFAARLTPQKRPDLLLSAFTQMSAAFPDVNLLFLGDGPERDRLTTQVREKHLEDRVRLQGHVTNMAGYYRACDVFVLPSDAEGLPNSLMEAMASGMACVASRIGGVVDIVEDGQNAFLFNAGDPASLITALKKALASPPSGDSLRTRARETMLERYRSGHIADHYLRLYKELVP